MNQHEKTVYDLMQMNDHMWSQIIEKIEYLKSVESVQDIKQKDIGQLIGRLSAIWKNNKKIKDSEEELTIQM